MPAMIPDILDLEKFYLSSLGLLVRRLLCARLEALWPKGAGDEEIVAIGHAMPFLPPFLQKAKGVVVLMPETLGATYWPREGENVVALAALERLPLPDESATRILVVHALEFAGDPPAFAQELWRILKPGGQAIVIAPYRRGLWALDDHTPFGTGRPYSASQLRRLLREQGFGVERLGHALLMPPWTSRPSLFLAPWIEKLTSFFPLAFGGVLVASLSKNVLTPLMTKKSPLTRRIILPFPMPSAPLPTGRDSA